MQFRIADTFTASLSRLPNEQQRAARTTAFDLQTNIARPGLQVHRVTGARDQGFWSARVNLDLRIIPHRNGENVVLCYVDSHDDAYQWAERRRLETHPTTVAVMACDAEVIPLQSRVESIVDEADLEEVYNTERNLLYVASTRARDHLLVTGVKPVSEFLDDLSNNDE